jgi:hypothetical protein
MLSRLAPDFFAKRLTLPITVPFPPEAAPTFAVGSNYFSFLCESFAYFAVDVLRLEFKPQRTQRIRKGPQSFQPLTAG